MIRDPSQCVKRFFSKTQPLTCQPIDLVKGPSRLGRVARAQTVHACSFLRSEAHQINSLETVFLRRKVASDVDASADDATIDNGCCPYARYSWTAADTI